MKKQFGEYYLGLDIGTDSVGWAATDLDYNILKLNKRALWGIRLFDAADTAAAMRGFRSARRRVARQKWRLGLLQDLFSTAVAKEDPTFFLRLKESNLHIEDKKQLQVKYSIFGDHLMTDKEYYAKYPTIYHLRKALLEDEAASFDIRLLYLALAHIIKHRGHFLFADLNANDIKNFRFIYQDLEEYLHNNLENFEEWSCPDVEELAAILKNKILGIAEKKKRLEKLLVAKTKQEKALAGFLSGSAAKLSDLFADEDLKTCEKDSFGFKKDNYEEVEPIIEKNLGSRMELIAKLKAVYDWSLLSEILNGQQYLSQAKVAIYEEHKADLALLKAHAKEKGYYKELFSYVSKTVNYSSYVGSCLLPSGEKAVIDKKCTQEDFCTNLKKLLGKEVDFKKLTIPDEQSTPWEKLLYKINLGTAFPKLRTKDNGVIPMQVHLAELESILKNAGKYFTFLEEKDAQGLSIQDKIIDIMKFRIPYYVGPLAGTELSRQKRRCWIVRKPEKIYPWNFDQVVDKEACAEKFIRNMTNKCTYLPSEDVLPKNSLLYTEFMARNELNNLALDGVRLPNNVINGIFKALVLHGKSKLTKKDILNHLQTLNLVNLVENEAIGKSKNKKSKEYKEELSGVDDTLQANMQSYKDFCRIFGEEYVRNHFDEIENIIRWITLFCEEKTMLLHKIHKEYPEITQKQLNEIKRLKYTDWGRLSKTFLDSSKIAYIDDTTGEYISIIAALRRENLNLMQLLSPACRYGFAEKLQAFNQDQINAVSTVDYAFVEEMAVSPAVKRSLWQSMLLVKEIKKITGHDPKRIFIEVARGEGEKKRTTSRKEALLALYKACKKEEKAFLTSYFADNTASLDDFIAALEKRSEADLRSNKLFLYYSQLGRCMYTGQKIELDDLYNDNRYDKDHIYPRSKTKDDSILNNLVLVKKELNSHKTDIYPLAPEIQQKMLPFWRMLKEKELITPEKYARLTRTTPLTEDELASFINRQLVETQQSTKAVAELLQIECPASTIVYSKAGNVSEFRHEYDFVKSRSVNDFHHAKDAYLNIVVGNVFHTRFTANPYNFIKKLHVGDKYTLNTKEIYKRDIERGGVVAWRAGKEGSMATVEATMQKNNILFTRMPKVNKGQLFDLTIMKKENGQIPIKQGMDIKEYGGYNKPATAYFMLVESKGKKDKLIRTIETVPIYLAKKMEEDQDILNTFLTQECGLIEPRVILPKIYKYALVKIDGCNMHITGKTTTYITAILASQLVLGPDWEKYVKKIDKVVERVAVMNNKLEVEKTSEQNIAAYDKLIYKYQHKIKNETVNRQLKTLLDGREGFVKLSSDKQKIVWQELLLALFDGITKEKNIMLYDLLLAKHKNNIYVNRPSGQIKTLEKGREIFIDLTVENQCLALSNILHLFSCKPITADLVTLKGSKNAGKVLFSKNISDKKQAYLYNQSVTGVFEQQIDLLKL